MMKTIRKILTGVLIATGVTLGAQAQQDKHEVKADQVPQAVRDAFSKAFANAQDVEWKKKGSDYKVSFELNNVDHHAMLNSSGTVVSRGMEIEESALPEAVRTALKTDHPNYRIDEAYTVEKDGTTSYKISLDGNPDRKVMYSADGKMIKNKKDRN